MPIIRCPHCGMSLNLDAQYEGSTVACPGCKASFTARAEPPSPTAVTPEPPRAKAPPADAVTAGRPAPAAADNAPDRPRRRPGWGDDRPPRRAGGQVTSGKALASLVLGLGTCCLPVLAAIPGLILGFLALRDISAAPERLKGKGLAIAGLIFSVIGNASLLSLLLVIPIYLGYVQARDRALTQNNLKQLGLAMHNYHDHMRRFPPQAVTSPVDKRPTLSWRVDLLPYLEQDALCRQFNPTAGWDQPPNDALLARMPPQYQTPFNPPADPKTTTHLQTTVGPNGLYPDPFARVQITSITDGTSNTILIVQATQDAVPWTKPQDLQVNNAQPLPAGLRTDKGQGFNVLMADGSVRFISPRIDEQTLRRLLDPRDGQPIMGDF